AAIAGILHVTALKIFDKSFGFIILAPFQQLHIEQGPVLELVGFPLTVVKGIATKTGMKVNISFQNRDMNFSRHTQSMILFTTLD
ncbi:hypothetical protein Goklo_004618, partial [Gossypium klotzschianum]|nr:hypothetical protein [Gossypium klotzschianum]